MTPDTRAAILESLRAGCTLAQAVSGAFGKRIPAAAWRELGKMRAADTELREACEAAEKREAEGGRPKANAQAERGGHRGGTGGNDVASVRARTEMEPVGVRDEPVVADAKPDLGDAKAEAGPAMAEVEGGPGHGGALAGAVVAAPDWAAVIKASAERQANEIVPPRVAAPKEPPKPPTPHDERWAAVRSAAESCAPGLLGHYLHQDDLLAARGLHRTSPWWIFVIRAFFEGRITLPTLQWILALVGRGGGKSSTLLRLAMVVALLADRKMDSNERWQWPFISVLKADAERRIFELEKLLRLAYPWLEAKALRGSLTIETEDAAGNAIEFLSMASTVGNVSGPSTMGGTVDEAAKMRSTGVNPDAELIVSLAETSRARENWIGVRCSSAWETRGAHHDAIVRGSNVVNFVASIGPDFIGDALDGYHDVAAWEAAQGNAKGAAQIRAWARTLNAHSPNVPTWVANSSISALASRILLETVPRSSEDEDIDATTYWLRECGSMPLARDGGGASATADSIYCGAITVARSKFYPGAKPVPGDVMKLPGLDPGDSRYDGGPKVRRAPTWRGKKWF